MFHISEFWIKYSVNYLLECPMFQSEFRYNLYIPRKYYDENSNESTSKTNKNITLFILNKQINIYTLWILNKSLKHGLMFFLWDMLRFVLMIQINLNKAQ